MKLGFQHLVCLSIPLLICACGSDTPSFVEKPEGIITLTIDKNATDENSFDMDELLSGNDELSADAVGVDADFAADMDAENTTDDEMESLDAGAREGEIARGQKPKIAANAATGSSPQSADAKPMTNEVDSGSTVETSNNVGGAAGSSGSSGSSGPSTEGTYTAKAVAKACLPHFRGLSQKIKVIDASAPTNISVSPGTVIAFKLTGNYASLNIHLPVGNDLPGVCFFVSGNHADVKFSTASQMDGFAYIAAGNQSSGAIEFLGGKPVRSHIELKGNQAALNVSGLDQDLCQEATLKGNAPQFQCSP